MNIDLNINNSIRVWHADNHQSYRDGLKMIIESYEPKIIIEKQAKDGKEAAMLLESLPAPDLLILDLEMGVNNGFKFLEQQRYKYPDLQILILTMHDDALSIKRVMGYQVNGYITKDIKKEEIILAINSILNGETYYQKSLLNTIMDINYNNGIIVNGTLLTKRCLEIISLNCKGKSNQEIADILNVQTKTIEYHKTKLFKNLNIKSSKELIILAKRNDWI